MSVEDFFTCGKYDIQTKYYCNVQYRCADVLNLLNNVLHDMKENQ